MKLSVIIVSYNTAHFTLQTIDSVLQEIAQQPFLLDQTEILVVDNHSQDESVTELKKLVTAHPKIIKLLQNTQNLGFAQANNRALKKAQGEYLLLLNSDTIVQQGALAQMVTRFEENPVLDFSANLAGQKGQLDKLGILAATLLNPDKTLQAQGGNFPTLFSLASHMLFLDDLPVVGQFFPSTQHTGKNIRQQLDTQESNVQQLDWVGGTAMMFRRQVLEEVGPLDQNIFMYGEDIEFCMRARDHHWDVAIEPAAQVIHFGSASSSSARAIIGEMLGYIYIWSKHKPSWQRPVVKHLLKLGCLLRIWLFGTMVKRPAKAQVYRELYQTLQKA
jgi:hypothetical protein